MSHLATTSSLSQLNADLRDALTDWLAEFDLNWQAGQIELQLKALPSTLQPFRSIALAELVKIDIERCWRHNVEATVESYVEQLPGLGSTETVVADLLLTEWEARCRSGKTPRFDDFVRRFPKQADSLRQLIERADVQAAAERKSSSPAVASPNPHQRDTSKVMGRDTASQALRRAANSTPTEHDIPEAFGRFRIVRKLGHGGMGDVYLADDTRLNRQVALKVPHFDRRTQAEVQERFDREAKAAANLDHPHICRVHEVGEFDGRRFMVLEFIDGPSLAEAIKAKPLTDAEAIRLVQLVAGAVGAAHDKKIIHRDLKPANIMLTADGQPKVTDFGLARRVDTDDQRLTHSGMILGTPAYMPPEQLTGELDKVGPASDVYSLGVILFELLTGHLPHEILPKTPIPVLCVRILTEPAALPTEFRPDLDPRLEAILLKATAKLHADRFASMSEFSAALQAVLDAPVDPGDISAAPLANELRRRTLRPRIVIALTFVAALLFGAIVWFRNGDAVVKVEILADDVEVSFVNESIKVIDGKTEYRVKPGLHRLRIKTGNAEFDSETFTLKRGGNPIVKIEPTNDRLIAKFGETKIGSTPLPVRKPIPTTPPAAEAEAAFVQGLSPGKWHDLLAMVKLPDHVVCGNWKQSPKGMLSSDPSVMPAVMIPVIIDGGYELDLEYARMSGKESVSITVPVGAGRTSVVTSGWGGKFHGLIEVDRVPLPELDSDSGAVTSPGTLENLRRNRLHIDVDVKNNEGHIQAVLNDQRIVDWTGDVQRLLPLTDAAMPCDRVPCLHSWISSADFRSLRLRLKPGARAVRLGDDWSNPLTVVRDAPPAEIADKCVKWNDRSYYFSDVPMHLTEAQVLASRWNGRLLTVSSQAEEDFLAANDGGRTFWTSGWRRWDDKEWRNDLNRPLRFLGGWSPSKPLDSETHSRLILWPCGLGWSNEQRQATAYACIEWGQEYASGSSDAVVIAPPKVAATAPPRPKDEPWVDPNLSKKPNVIHGKWWLEGEELVTQSVAPRNFIAFGDPQWTDYDLKVEASCDKIGVSYNLFLRWFEEENFWLLQFGNYGAKNMDLVAYVPGEYGWRMPTRRYMPNSLHGEAKVWHHIEVKVRGINIIVLVDGQVMTTSSHSKLHHGCVGFHTFSEGNARWRNLEVRTPEGKLLWNGFPTLPPEQLSETAQSYKAACDSADEFLLAEFDKVIERTRTQKTDNDEATRQTLAAIQEEQAHFQSNQRIPFSSAMRAASISYLERIAKARKEFEVAIDRRRAELKSSKAPTALEDSNTLVAEKTRYLAPRVVGFWELYTPNGVFHDVILRSDGTFERSIGQLPGTWTLDEKHLIFTSPRPGNAGGNYVDTNVVSDDGRTYTGSNQLGYKFTGKRKRPDASAESQLVSPKGDSSVTRSATSELQVVVAQGHGKWRIDDGQLWCAEPSGDSEDWLLVGDPNWTDYDFTVWATTDHPLKGHGPGILFRSRSKDHAYFMATNVFKSDLDYIDEYDGSEHRKSSWNDPSIPTFKASAVRDWSGQGHEIKASVRGTTVRFFIDGNETMKYDKLRHPKGYVGVRSHKDWPSRYYNPKVTAPDGRVLLDAWPKLPPP